MNPDLYCTLHNLTISRENFGPVTTRPAQSTKVMLSILCKQTSGYNRACWSSTSSISMCQAVFADVSAVNSGTNVQVYVKKDQS